MGTDSRGAKPARPCPNCHPATWYLPGEYYAGKKQWLCGRCHPEPKVIWVSPDPFLEKRKEKN